MREEYVDRLGIQHDELKQKLHKDNSEIKKCCLDMRKVQLISCNDAVGLDVNAHT